MKFSKTCQIFLSKFQFRPKKFKIAPLNLNFPHEKLILLSKTSNFKAFLVNICCTGTGTDSTWAVLVLVSYCTVYFFGTGTDWQILI